MKILEMQLSAKVENKYHKEILNHFRAFDHNGDGSIDFDEFVETLNRYNVIQRLSWSEEQTRKAFNSIDLNGNGKIDYKEFVCLIAQKILLNNETILESIFNELDSNNDGKIDAAELLEKFSNHSHSLSPGKIMKIISEVDFNKDGTISYQELLQVVNEFKDSRISY